MNHKNKQSNNIHPILFFISLTLFLCLLSSPSWAVELDTLMLKARQTSWQGNYDESVAIYQQLINENPNGIEAMLGLATVLGWQKKFQESSTVYQKVREMHPDIPDGELGLMRLKAWQGEHAAAEEGLKILHSKYPERFDILIFLGQVTAWQKKFQESSTVYQKVREMHPDIPDGELGLMHLKAWQGEHAAAEEGLKVLHSKYPEHFDILMLLGQVTARQKKYQASTEYYKKALLIHPGDREAIKGLATTYKWMKNTKEGIKLYEKILEKDPNNVDALMGTGILLSHAGKNKEAIVFLEKARDIAPDRADVRAMLGTLYSWTAQLDDAVTEFQKSVALEQGNISNFIALGRIFKWQKKKKASITLYQRALELTSNNTEAMVGLGKVYLADDQWDKAEELYLKSLDINPNDLDAKEALAQLKRIQAPETNIRYNFSEYRLHENPKKKQITSTFIEHRETLESFFKLSPQTTIQARFQHAERRLLGLLNTTTLINTGVETTSVGLSQKLPYNFNLRFRYDLSRFSNDNISNTVSNLQKSENEYSGFFILEKKYDRHLWRVSLGRELFEAVRSEIATIEDINTYSISYDTDFSEFFSALAVLSFDDNSIFADQQDHLIRTRYRLPNYSKVQFEYQFRYLSNPSTYENTVGVNFQNQLGSKVHYEASYFVTLSENTAGSPNIFSSSRGSSRKGSFVQNSFKVFYSWDILPWLSWSVDATVSLDYLFSNKATDTTQNYQTYLTIKF